MPPTSLEELQEQRKPLIITQNGEAKAVLQDVASYEETQETLALLKILALATPLLRQFHLAQERFVAGIRFEVLEQPVSLDEIKTRILLRVGAIEPSDCLIALGPVRM